MSLWQYAPSLSSSLHSHPTPTTHTLTNNPPSRTYRGLNFKTRLGVGAGLLIWGVIGLQFSDKAGEKLGYAPTEADKAALDKMTPKIHTVPREKS